MTTFVLGSKENPLFPKIRPDKIIFANGAIGSLSESSQDLLCLPKTCMVTPYLFSNSSSGPYFKREDLRLHTLNQIYDSGLDILIVRPGLDVTETEVRDQISTFYDKLNQPEVIFLTYHDMNKLIISAFGVPHVLTEIFRVNPKRAPQICRFSTLKKFKVSTGILSLIYCIQSSHYRPPYYLIGVGCADSGYSYTKTYSADRGPHLAADIACLKSLARSRISNQIVITDPDLNNLYSSFHSDYA